jgi:hypothetical protein
MKRSVIFFVCGSILIMAVFAIWAKSQHAKWLKPEDVLDGRHSKIATQEYHLVTDQQQWREIWRRHQIAERRPGIDFSRHMVVAIFLGEISQCTGITVQGTTYRKTDDHLDIHYRPQWYTASYDEEELERNPEKYDRLHAASPFGFIVVRRAARASVYEDVQGLRDADPEYELQAELSKESPVVKLAAR